MGTNCTSLCYMFESCSPVSDENIFGGNVCDGSRKGRMERWNGWGRGESRMGRERKWIEGNCGGGGGADEGQCGEGGTDGYVVLEFLRLVLKVLFELWYVVPREKKRDEVRQELSRCRRCLMLLLVASATECSLMRDEGCVKSLVVVELVMVVLTSCNLESWRSSSGMGRTGARETRETQRTEMWARRSRCGLKEGGEGGGGASSGSSSCSDCRSYC